MSDDVRPIPFELSEFASLMVDELIATVRVKLEAGEGLTLGDQKLLLEQLIKDRARADRAALTASRSSNDEIEQMRTVLARMVSAQMTDPIYRGWNITALNKATEEARSLLGMPSAIDEQTAKMIASAKRNNAAARLSKVQTGEGHG